MDLTLFKSINLPPPELASVLYLKVAQLGDSPTAVTGGAKELRRVSPPRACNKQPQSKAKGKQPRASAVSFHLPQGLIQPPLKQACPYELSDLAWQQPAFHQPHALPSIALHQPVAQQQALATTALIDQVIEPTTRRPSSEKQASPRQSVRRSKTKKESEETANKLHPNLEKVRSFQEIELAVNTSEEDLRESQAVVKHAQLRAYFEVDLSLFPAEEIKKAKQKAGESLEGAYESVPRTSFTAHQLQRVIQTTWSVQQQSLCEGTVSLKARILDTSFKQQLFDLELSICESSHMSLKILLTLSLINRWDVITTNLSSALLQAPTVSEEPVLVDPSSELEPDPGVLWKLTKALYGINSSPELWQQFLASKLEELGLKKNTNVPCTFTSAQLMVMHHLDTLLIVGDKYQQESFISQLSAYVTLTNTTKLDAKTPSSFMNKTLKYNQQDRSISLSLPSAYYMQLFKMYDMETLAATSIF